MPRVLAFWKPPGLSLATKPSEPGAAVKRLVEATDPSDVAAHGLDAATLHLVHRLDEPTTGVVLVARDKDMHRALTRAFETRAVLKTYLALCWGRPRPKEGLFEQPLGPDRKDRRRMRVDPEGRPARTRYRVLAAPGHASLVELRPETGRTHQIRVHLAAAGHPIVGDDLYGGPRHHGVRERALKQALQPSHALLHAASLRAPALLDQPALAVSAPLPPEFRRALQALDVAEPETEPRGEPGGEPGVEER